MILHLFITFHLISYSIGQLHITCFDSRSSGRYCLSYINKKATWENATSYCMARNGTLAVLENNDITSKINSSLERASIKVDTCWVGGYKHDGKWIWLNGNPMAQTQFLKGNGDCIFLNVNKGVILNYLCDKERPFVCQFNIDHYAFCVPGMSLPNEICYTYVKNDHLTSWCAARESCFKRGDDLASLDRDVETLGKFLIDAHATRVFVGAVFNLTRWQWLNGNNIDHLNKTLLEISPSVYHCTVLARSGDFALLPIKCNDSAKFDFLCKGDPENTTSQNTSSTSVCSPGMQTPTQPYEPLVSTANAEHISFSPVWYTDSQTSAPETFSAVFTSRTVLKESPIMSSEKGNITPESITINSLQIVSYGSSSKAIILGGSIGGGVFVIAMILIIILHRRRQLSGKRPLMSSKKFSESAHEFSMKAISRDIEHEPTFIENPLYEATNINSSFQEK